MSEAQPPRVPEPADPTSVLYRQRRLAAQLAGERKQIERMAGGLAKQLFTLPWLKVPPIGVTELSKLVSATALADATHG